MRPCYSFPYFQQLSCYNRALDRALDRALGIFAEEIR